MTDDNGIFSRIDELVAEEHELRVKHAAGQVGDADEATRLRALEVELDQCWDLLRQRRAKPRRGVLTLTPRPVRGGSIRSPGSDPSPW
jgi:hypothetical protein